MLSSSISNNNMDDSLSLSGLLLSKGAYREWIAAVDFLLALLGGKKNRAMVFARVA